MSNGTLRTPCTIVLGRVGEYDTYTSMVHRYTPSRSVYQSVLWCELQ